ncbi:hypothetical protein HNV11_02170 [Spirosoma taeanense]|uniref:Outer membrane protein beta-barrel domain-containing protein n=1 Tax=Spirosoma taeanense TaxID=2735870 RepID=A0A6M5YG12_9BACT|nr:hypothetical protein HNV11_02170 [Spirosoma taeanense]
MRKGLFTFVVAGVLLTITQLQAQDKPPVYPRVAGYVGLLHPLLTYSQQEMSSNFNGYYVVGLPTGINLWKSDRVGFSVEFVPQIRVENGVSRMSNFLFHPGLLVNLGHGYTFAGRVAFETSGRYGFTPVLNKIVKRGRSSTLFVAVPLPVRFGLDRPASLTAGFQFGIGF